MDKFEIKAKPNLVYVLVACFFLCGILALQISEGYKDDRLLLSIFFIICSILFLGANFFYPKSVYSIKIDSKNLIINNDLYELAHLHQIWIKNTSINFIPIGSLLKCTYRTNSGTMIDCRKGFEMIKEKDVQHLIIVIKHYKPDIKLGWDGKSYFFGDRV